MRSPYSSLTISIISCFVTIGLLVKVTRVFSYTKLLFTSESLESFKSLFELYIFKCWRELCFPLFCTFCQYKQSTNKLISNSEKDYKYFYLFQDTSLFNQIKILAVRLKRMDKKNSILYTYK
jgi:hypothetical protein